MTTMIEPRAPSCSRSSHKCRPTGTPRIVSQSRMPWLAWTRAAIVSSPPSSGHHLKTSLAQSLHHMKQDIEDLRTGERKMANGRFQARV